MRAFCPVSAMTGLSMTHIGVLSHWCATTVHLCFPGSFPSPPGAVYLRAPGRFFRRRPGNSTPGGCAPPPSPALVCPLPAELWPLTDSLSSAAPAAAGSRSGATRHSPMCAGFSWQSVVEHLRQYVLFLRVMFGWRFAMFLALFMGRCLCPLMSRPVTLLASHRIPFAGSG